ncbi:hypothetical protein [Frigoriglobus tundricola]|uniref:Uncharacterized protein n=1 Tax=Frigoriglobus tundricola TaxID=2774151 RepID=A0A6M5YQQ9_9BACT|nr:hypothetical protein [Frigoriglobus tundricola]QJW95696.1 hypothetical protein FTUN_3250 [Frigoriglobus tundricola]
MSTHLASDVDVPPALLDAVAALPLAREVSHCGKAFAVSPFDLYVTCPVCKARFKVRSFGAVSEIEDVFDAVFAWMNQPGAAELVQKRRLEIAQDPD